MLEHIYICRHGFRSNWVDPSIKTGPTGMPRDPPLAAYGLTQAASLASFFSAGSSHTTDSDSITTSTDDAAAPVPHPKPERVFSSAFYRCIQTALPTAQALGVGVSLEHGVGEWYSPVNPSTGLHPRPSPSTLLAQYFPPSSLDLSYTPTLYPSRKGESLKGLQDRADLFVEAWTSRVEELYPDVRCVVVFAHAASVIALGRALTGDKSLNIPAGCASTSLYRRKRKPQPDAQTNGTPTASAPMTPTRSSNSLNAAQGLVDLSMSASIPTPSANSELEHCGVGQWEGVYLGRADYLENGLERDWSFRDVVIVDGEVVTDDGDHGPHPPADELPEGLAPGMDKYLRRGRPAPNEWAHEAKFGEANEVKGRM